MIYHIKKNQYFTLSCNFEKENSNFPNFPNSFDFVH